MNSKTLLLAAMATVLCGAATAATPETPSAAPALASETQRAASETQPVAPASDLTSAPASDLVSDEVPAATPVVVIEPKPQAEEARYRMAGETQPVKIYWFLGGR